MTNKSQKVCIVTGSRAEYDLLSGVLSKISKDPDMELQLIVTGAHLSKKFGHTVDTIQNDGFPIAARIESLQPGDDYLSTSKSIAAGIVGAVDAFYRLSPDIVMVLGDRYEMLATVQAALISQIPVAHIHGGELTIGAFDDAIRHAITKMSHIHFVAAQPYAQRVIQMGEIPKNVHIVGALGLDNINNMEFLSREKLSKFFGLKIQSPFFLVTYHPVTLSDKFGELGLKALISVLDSIDDAIVVFTGVNSDPGHERIANIIYEFCQSNPERTANFTSLGQLRYLSAMNLANVVVGNSSSGIIEAPALGIPTVNIGRRQDGRIKANTIVDCGETVDEISIAMEKALQMGRQKFKSHRGALKVDSTASDKIIQVLKSTNLGHLLLKDFHSINGIV